MKDFPTHPELKELKQKSLFLNARQFERTPKEKLASIKLDVLALVAKDHKLLATEICCQDEPYATMGRMAYKEVANDKLMQGEVILIYLKNNTAEEKYLNFGTKVIGQTRFKTNLYANDMKLIDPYEVFALPLERGFYFLLHYGTYVPGDTKKTYRPIIEVTKEEFLEYKRQQKEKEEQEKLILEVQAKVIDDEKKRCPLTSEDMPMDEDLQLDIVKPSKPKALKPKTRKPKPKKANSSPIA